MYIGYAAALLGDAEICAEVLPIAERNSERFLHLVFDGALITRLAGMMAATCERWDDAERHFTEAQRIADAFPNRWDEPHVWLWRGKALLARGRPEDASRGRELVEKAGAEFESRGMPLHAELASR
jgi:hypothetical protein